MPVLTLSTSTSHQPHVDTRYVTSVDEIFTLFHFTEFKFKQLCVAGG
jgi:hypothetical protein